VTPADVYHGRRNGWARRSAPSHDVARVCQQISPTVFGAICDANAQPYDFEPKTLGKHVRKRRLKLGLMQKEVAEQLGVNPWTVLNWENGHTEPPISAIPTIIRFLRYDPFPQPQTVAEHLLAKRREMGWSVQEAAQVLGVDPMT
jgi:DNA-binding XRE family transcriptional regulator